MSNLKNICFTFGALGLFLLTVFFLGECDKFPSAPKQQWDLYLDNNQGETRSLAQTLFVDVPV